MKLTNAGPKKLLEKPGRRGDGAGFFFRTLGGEKAYWVYRYRTGGREREFSIGPYPEVSLTEARAKHMKLRKRVVVDKSDPSPRDAWQGRPQPKRPRLGSLLWRNRRRPRRDQGRPMEKRQAPGAVGDDVKEILRADPRHAGRPDRHPRRIRVLAPLWTETPETASRLLAPADGLQTVAGSRRTNPARHGRDDPRRALALRPARLHQPVRKPATRRVDFRRGRTAANVRLWRNRASSRDA